MIDQSHSVLNTTAPTLQLRVELLNVYSLETAEERSSLCSGNFAFVPSCPAVHPSLIPAKLGSG